MIDVFSPSDPYADNGHVVSDLFFFIKLLIYTLHILTYYVRGLHDSVYAGN